MGNLSDIMNSRKYEYASKYVPIITPDLVFPSIMFKYSPQNLVDSVVDNSSYESTVINCVSQFVTPT